MNEVTDPTELEGLEQVEARKDRGEGMETWDIQRNGVSVAVLEVPANSTVESLRGEITSLLSIEAERLEEENAGQEEES